MRKDYKTIREVVGPLMTVDHVAGVKYDELVEIHQANGEVRSGRVLVIDGDRALSSCLKVLRVCRLPRPRLVS